MVLFAETVIPTEYGMIRTVVFRETGKIAGAGEPREHVALVVGDVANGGDVFARVHSECWTGEVVHSLKCDCREQLDTAIRHIVAAGRGVVLYLRQEGRGIGLGNKIRAYALQAQGFDTVDANRSLGFRDDAREYGVAALMLRELGVRSVALLTNNPAKVDGLRRDGVTVSRRVAMEVTANEHNAGYLATKNQRMGHVIPGMVAFAPTARDSNVQIEQGEPPITAGAPPARVACKDVDRGR